MTRDEALDLVKQTTEAWVADADSDVVWAGSHEGRWGIRMRQDCREATTIWFDVGDLTVGFEAYLLPAPPAGAGEVYRHCLARNHRAWPAAIAIDRRGDLFVLGRIPLDGLTSDRLDEAVGAVYEVVELSFPALLRLGYRSREKTP